jgi:hypothetical protein
VYGGDGGAPVSYYVVEWDTREDFGTPASRATVYGEFYEIGGRDFMSGKQRVDLLPDKQYYIRVTAFNAKGAGVAGVLPYSVTTANKEPDAPRNVIIAPMSASSIMASWDHPSTDGGVTLEKYRLQYSSDSFGSYSTVDLPVVAEVQTVVAESNVDIEKQAIRVISSVTNERQIVRTNVNGIDEVQTITTTCDDVTNDVQRITTNAIDIDEVQTLEIIGTDVNEVQLLQTYTDDLPEIQILEISSSVIPAVQRIGVIMTNIVSYLHLLVHYY